MLQPHDHVADFVDDFLHGVLSPEDARTLEDHCDVCSPCQGALAEARKRQAALQTLPAREASPRLVQAILGRVRDYNARQRRLRRAFGWGTLVATAASVLVLVAMHVYYLRLAPSPYDLAVLSQSRFLPATAGSMCIRLVNRATGTALAGVSVDVELRGKDRAKTVRLARFETDAQGIGQPQFTVPDWADGDYTLHVVAHPDGQVEEVAQRVALKRSWKLMLSSDKPVYQPGQTIHLRALALRKPDLKPVVAENALITITDPKGNVVFKRQATTSAYGITAADCPLSTEVNEGPYTIACRVGDTDSRLTVDVKKYVLPKFKIDLAGLASYYQPGQTVQGTLNAKYFFGGPVANGRVEIVVRHAGVAGEIQRLKLATDENGVVPVRLELPKQLPGREQDGGDARVFLDVQVRDTAGQEERRTFSRVVTDQPLKVAVIPENGRLVNGMANRVWLYASSADGAPLPGVAVTAARGDKPGRDALNAVTNDLGVAMIEVVPTADVEAWSFTASDPKGRSTKWSVTLACNQSTRDFILRADQAVYTGGDTMQLTALGGGPSTVYVDLIKDGQTYRSEAIDMKDGRGAAEIDLPPDLFGTIELCAYRFDATGLPVRKSRVFYVRPARQLTVQAKADKDEYRPGQRAKLNFTVTDAAGKPAPGALSLAAVDEAVFSVLEQAPGMERTFYTLEQELLQPIFTIYPWSPDGRFAVPPAERQQFEQALFARTAAADAFQPDRRQRGERFAVVEDMAPSESAPGMAARTAAPHSLTVFSFPVKQRAVATARSDGFERVALGWGLLGAALAFTGYIALWTFARWTWVLVAHAAVVPVGCMLLTFVALLGGKAGSSFDMIAGAVRMEAPGGAESTVAEGMDDSGGAAGSVRVRREFPETLLWKPELITDDQGRASLDLDLADSITTWRLTASAVSGDGLLGGVQASVKVFQPFFVDLNLPGALTRGDEVAVPVVVYNYLDEDQTVELALADADWFERLGEPMKRVTLKARAVQAVHYRLRVARAGKHTLQVTAKAGAVADAIERTVEVVPNGRKVEQVVTDRLNGAAVQTIDIPEQAVPGSAKIMVKLYPGVFSQIVEGLDGMLRMPYGCFEQTSSTTYPNVLIADYLKKSRAGSPPMLAKAEQYIHLGYQRLLTFEVRGGGFDWYGRGPANVWLTAYGLQEFHDMARVHEIDPKLIDRTQRWLLSQQNNDGSWGDRADRWSPDMGDQKLLLTSYVAWSLLETGCRDPKVDRAVNYLLGHLGDAKNSTYLLALIANALTAWDVKDPRTLAVLQRLDAGKQDVPDWQATCFPTQGRSLTFATGSSATVETTALAVLALRRVEGYEPTINRALTYLVKSKDGAGAWGSTQATILALKALIAGLSSPPQEEKATFTVLINGKEAAQGEVTPLNADVLQLFDLEKHTLTGKNEVALRVQGKTNLMYQIVGRHYDARPEPQAAQPALAIDVQYDRTELSTGDVVKATATVRNQSKETANMVIVDLGVPPGFEVNAADFNALVKPNDPTAPVEKVSVTARQVILYLKNLQPGGTFAIDYTLKPKFPVKVQTPTFAVYEYYTPANRATAKETTLTVDAK